MADSDSIGFRRTVIGAGIAGFLDSGTVVQAAWRPGIQAVGIDIRIRGIRYGARGVCGNAGVKQLAMDGAVPDAAVCRPDGDRGGRARWIGVYV